MPRIDQYQLVIDKYIKTETSGTFIEYTLAAINCAGNLFNN